MVQYELGVTDGQATIKTHLIKALPPCVSLLKMAQQTLASFSPFHLHMDCIHPSYSPKPLPSLFSSGLLAPYSYEPPIYTYKIKFGYFLLLVCSMSF